MSGIHIYFDAALLATYPKKFVRKTKPPRISARCRREDHSKCDVRCACPCHRSGAVTAPCGFTARVGPSIRSVRAHKPGVVGMVYDLLPPADFEWDADLVRGCLGVSRVLGADGRESLDSVRMLAKRWGAEAVYAIETGHQFAIVIAQLAAHFALLEPGYYR